jgi:ligand-binding SRPBCC domain-containing protein
MKNFTFQVESPVNCESEKLWLHVTQMQNINYELMPFARMTYPKERAALNVSDVPLQTTLIKSVILLFGFIPVDLHLLRLDNIVSGQAFYENSTTLMHCYWKHTRTLKPKGNVTVIKDEVSFSPRLPLVGHLLLPVYRHIFQHRHRKLQAFFN